jgi:exopolysaccharide production protein ExoQ
MPPVIAGVLCAVLIAYLFWRELSDPSAEKISWVPFAWMFIAGSRFVSSWTNMRAPGTVFGVDGSPVDRAYFLSLIILGSIVLFRRRIAWGSFFAQHKWLVAYFAYCLLSILWADLPFVLFKRWVKELGNPIMVLILLTERRPYDAVTATIRRLSYVFVPLSVLFIKWYPQMGRYYTTAGGGTFTGVADQKNTLGLLCFLTGLFYLWSVLYRRDAVAAVRHRHHVLLLGMLAWVISMANSQTALICLVVSASILLLSKRPAIARQPSRLTAVVLSCAVVYMVADATIGVKDHILTLLGRDPTLTDRTLIWDTVRSQAGNPWVGTGFMSFWQGERLLNIADTLKMSSGYITQAHNGYLEQYVNLGYIGVMFIAGIVLSAVIRIHKQFATDYSGAVLCFTIVIAALLYNYTEASFGGVNNMWLLLLLTGFRPPASVNTAEATVPAKTLRTSRFQRPRQPQPAYFAPAARRARIPVRSR